MTCPYCKSHDHTEANTQDELRGCRDRLLNDFTAASAAYTSMLVQEYDWKRERQSLRDAIGTWTIREHAVSCYWIGDKGCTCGARAANVARMSARRTAGVHETGRGE